MADLRCEQLTKTQGQRLLKLYLTGEMGGGAWSTVKALDAKGMIKLGHKVTVTPKGIKWCDANHMNY